MGALQKPRLVTLPPTRKIVIPDRELFRDFFRERLAERADSSRGPLARLLAPKYRAYASGWVDGEEQDILELWFQGTALPLDPSHISLFTTTPIDIGTGGVEGVWGAYARIALANTVGNWGSSVAGAPSTIQNLTVNTFAEATSGSGTVLSWGYHTAITAGTLLFFGILDASKVISTGDTPQFNAGDMVAKLGDPGDVF